MAVITVSRQLGSHGARIARALAKELGYTLVGKNLINEVIRQYGLTRLNLIYDRKPKISELFNENSAITIQMMNETIATIAARGNVVILGRGGFKVLQGMADVLNIFVKAPDNVRSKRIGKRNHIEPDEAAELIKTDDELRARFVRLFYGAKWADESEYDLVIDTGVDSDEAAIAKIIAAVQALPPSGDDDRTAATIEVDPVLRDTVETALARRAKKA